MIQTDLQALKPEYYQAALRAFKSIEHCETEDLQFMADFQDIICSALTLAAQSSSEESACEGCTIDLAHALGEESVLTANWDDLLNKVKGLAQPKPNHADLEAAIVPGMMHCAKCKFVQTRTNLYVKSGTTGAGDNKTEPCPNGCGNLWPYTWKQMAESYGERLEQQFDEIKSLKAARSQLSGQSDADFLKVLADNRWDLYKRDEAQPPVDARELLEALEEWINYYLDGSIMGDKAAVMRMQMLSKSRAAIAKYKSQSLGG